MPTAKKREAIRLVQKIERDHQRQAAVLRRQEEQIARLKAMLEIASDKPHLNLSPRQQAVLAALQEGPLQAKQILRRIIDSGAGVSCGIDEHTSPRSLMSHPLAALMVVGLVSRTPDRQAYCLSHGQKP